MYKMYIDHLSITPFSNSQLYSEFQRKVTILDDYAKAQVSVHLLALDIC